MLTWAGNHIFRIVAALATLLVAVSGFSASVTKDLSAPRKELPQIAIILDDLGYNRKVGEQALQLPGPVTYAIIPFTPYSKIFAEQAKDRNRQVILHLPMESSDPNRALDKGGLSSELDEAEIRSRIHQAIEDVPHIVGMNNHMGSQLTSNVEVMHWLMQELQQQPLFFIDSMTHPHSVANTSAKHYNIPSLKRDVFLDNVQTESNIDRQFNRLVNLAKKKGHAIGIGHPYPATLAYLEKALPKLEQLGVELVETSKLVAAYGTTVNQPVDIKELMRWIVAMPAPQSQRLNFSN